MLEKDVARLQVVPPGVDATDQTIEIFGLTARDDATHVMPAAAHLHRFVEGLEPHVGLFRQGAIGRDWHILIVDIDVALPHPRSLCVGNQHRRSPVAIFVRGKTDDMVGIAASQIVDLVELKFLVFRGIKRNG